MKRRHSLATTWPTVALLLGFSFPLLFARLGERDLWSSHEGRAAQNAQTILNSGCWGLPRLFDRKLELQKPPLYYWSVAAISWLRGTPVDTWSVRLPAALSALGCVLLIHHLAAQRNRSLAGLFASVFLATCVHFTWLARTGRIDMPLAFAVTLSLVAFHATPKCAPRRRPWVLLTAYLAIAAGVLLKGPIGLVLPFVVMTAKVVVESGQPLRCRAWLDAWRELGCAWGIPLAIGVALPWFLWANAQTDGQLARSFLWYHNVERALGTGGLRYHPWWFYGPRIAIDLLPWSLLIPGALLATWRWKDCHRDPLLRFGLVWFASIAVLLSCVGFKRADYLLPAYPGAALWLGCVAEHASRRWGLFTRLDQRSLAFAGGILLGASVSWLTFLGLALPRSEPAKEMRTFARAIRNIVPPHRHLILFRAEEHALAFHLGGHLDTVLEWENLDVWAGTPGEHFVVIPPECLAESTAHLASGKLVEVLRNTDLAGGYHDRPLVLARTVPVDSSEDRYNASNASVHSGR